MSLMLKDHLVKLNRPHWLKRLREWRAEAREDTRTFVAAAIVFALLAGLLTIFGERFPSFNSLVAIPAACFGVIAAISVFVCAGTSCAFILSSAFCYAVETIYRVTELLLTLLQKLFRLARSILPYMDAARIGTGISLLLTLWIFKNSGIPYSMYLLIGSGVAAEVIYAVIRHIMAKLEGRRQPPNAGR